MDLPCHLAGGFWRYTGRNKKCFVPAVPLMTAKLLMSMRSDAHDAVGAWASPETRDARRQLASAEAVLLRDPTTASHTPR
jgi:hypothetical protein